jgi:hypothetical protein
MIQLQSGFEIQAQLAHQSDNDEIEFANFGDSLIIGLITRVAERHSLPCYTAIVRNAGVTPDVLVQILVGQIARGASPGPGWEIVGWSAG